MVSAYHTYLGTFGRLPCQSTISDIFTWTEYFVGSDFISYMNR